MKWPIIVALTSSAITLTGGCASQVQTKTQQQQAREQWDTTRATVLYGLARDQYQNGNFDKCTTTLADALRIDATNAKIHELAGKLAIEQGKLELAEEHLKLARQYDPKDAEADYLSGVVCQRWQKPEAAYEFYSHAAQKMPSELSYVLAQSEMLVSMNRSSEALALLEDKLIYFEHSAIIRDAAGQLLSQQGKFPEAIEMLHSASILATDDGRIREHLALAFYANRQYRDASDIFSRLLADHTNDTRADLYLAQGDCQLQLNHPADARGSFDVASRLSAADLAPWLGLAQAALQLNDLPRAELATQRAVALNSQSPQVCLLMGYVRTRQNRITDALTAFSRAHQLDSDDTTSLCMMGYALEKLGRSGEAMKCYMQALKLQPKDELAAKLLAKLDVGTSAMN